MTTPSPSSYSSSSSSSSSSDAEDSFQKVLTVSAALHHRAQHFPDTAALIFRAPKSDDERRVVLTWKELYDLGGRWASVLHSRGIGRGQHVVSTLPNSPERAVVDAAILLSGAATVDGFCGMSDASDLKSILRQSSAVALILDPDFDPDMYAALLRDITEPLEDGSVTSESLPDLKFLLLVRRREGGDNDNPGGGSDFLRSLREDVGRRVFVEEGVKEEDVCAVFATSGSTGFPKLVAFSHRPLVMFVKSLKRPTNFVVFNVNLMGWSNGFIGTTILYGATRVLCDFRAGWPEDFPLFIYTSVKEEGVTSGGVPFYLLPGLAKKVESLNGGQPIFQLLGLGSQPTTKLVVKEASKVAQRMLIAYAGTETMVISVAFHANVDVFENYFTGRPVPGVEVKVCDEQGEEVKADTRGEILVRSPYLFREYLNDPGATSAAFTEDGFFRTGDLGWVDGEGRLYVEGRGKDTIMRGRNFIYPGSMESRIINCPAVADVVVVGVPDAIFQNEFCVCVVLKPGDWSVEDVKQFVEKDIREAEYEDMSETPRYFVVFDRFPVTSTGKTHRAEVKRMAERKVREDQ
ncbi:putative acyl-CoA synthetase YngI [Babylonia areolata]|uniref:putative acyl-CoA synthetase YngI n=1 Tax=Babylonia areolata TaxID=304850 RepID=UPI003FD0950A